MSATDGQSPTRLATLADLAQLHDEIGVGETMTDDLAGELEDRVVAIEELLSARGWQRFKLRRQLARHLRSQVVAAVRMDGDWQARRTEYVSQDWLTK